MQLVPVLCLPVSSIPTSLSFLKSFCPCFYLFCDMHIVQAQLHRQSMHDKYHVELLVDSNYVSSFLEKRGCRLM